MTFMFNYSYRTSDHLIKAEEYKYNMFIIDLWNMKKILSG